MTTAVLDFTPQREAKAAALAACLLELGAPVDEVARFVDADRRMAERAALIRRASDETWRLAIEMLAGSGRARSRCPYCGHGDPAGEPGADLPFGHDGPCRQ